MFYDEEKKNYKFRVEWRNFHLLHESGLNSCKWKRNILWIYLRCQFLQSSRFFITDRMFDNCDWCAKVQIICRTWNEINGTETKIDFEGCMTKPRGIVVSSISALALFKNYCNILVLMYNRPHLNLFKQLNCSGGVECVSKNRYIVYLHHHFSEL